MKYKFKLIKHPEYYTPLLMINDHVAWDVIGNSFDLQKKELVVETNDEKDFIIFVRFCKRNASLKPMFKSEFIGLRGEVDIYNRQMQKYGRSIVNINEVHQDIVEVRNWYRKLIHIYNKLDEKELGSPSRLLRIL